jgi:aspartokinase-like uncharacterized kinase
MTHPWQRGPLTPTAAAVPARAGVVVKLGGSLLTRRDWPAAMRALCGTLGQPVLLVVGGGPVVDGLRAIDEVAALPTPVSHRLAIDALGITARAVSTAIGLPLTAHPHDAGPMAVLDTPRWLDDDGRLAALQVGWHVTSDSIAALVAARLHRPLVLAKSVPPPAAADLRALAVAGWIDPCFPDAAANVPRIEWAVPLHPATPPH